MAFLTKLPIPTGTRLAWQRTLLERAYAKDISTARRLKNNEKVESLERDHRFELDLHDEEEDSHLTRTLLGQARRLHVQIPHRYNEDKTESDLWYEGHYTGHWYLTPHGITVLREEIRSEVKARHEGRAQWVVWLSALTGVVGAITGLVALLTHNPL